MADTEGVRIAVIGALSGFAGVAATVAANVALGIATNRRAERKETTDVLAGQSETLYKTLLTEMEALREGETTMRQELRAVEEAGRKREAEAQKECERWRNNYMRCQEQRAVLEGKLNRLQAQVESLLPPAAQKSEPTRMQEGDTDGR